MKINSIDNVGKEIINSLNFFINNPESVECILELIEDLRGRLKAENSTLKDQLHRRNCLIKKLRESIRELNQKLMNHQKGHCLYEGATERKCPYEVKIK